MLNPRAIFGYVIFFGTVFFACWLGGSITIFIDIPSILLVLGGALGLWMAVHFLGVLKGSFLTLAFFITAVLGDLIGSVQMLQNLTDPSAIGPSMAVCMLTSLYGLVSCCLFAYPLEDYYHSRFGDDQTFSLSKIIWILFPVYSGLAFLAIFFVLLFSLKTL